jgi:predicted DNA-binding protein (MmcQ/YjbR family)
MAVAARRARELERSALARLRRIGAPLPEAIETKTFGHPTFPAGEGRTFAVLDDHERDDELCLVFEAARAEQRKLLRTGNFFPSKFGAQHGWTTVEVAPRLDWGRVRELVVASYRLVANQRMLAALDASGRRRTRPGVARARRESRRS